MVQKSYGPWILFLFVLLKLTTGLPSAKSCQVTAKPEGGGNCPVLTPHMNSVLFGNESHYFPALTGGSQRIYIIVQVKNNHPRETDPPHLKQCLHTKDIRLAVPFTPGDPVDLMNVYVCHGHSNCTNPGDCGGECCSKICTYVIDATACVGLIPRPKVLTPGEIAVCIIVAVLVVLSVIIAIFCWRYYKWTRTALPKEIIVQCHPEAYAMDFYQSLRHHIENEQDRLPQRIKIINDQSLFCLFFKILFRRPSIYLIVYPRQNTYVSRVGICGILCHCCCVRTKYESFCNLAKILSFKRGFRVVEDSRSGQIDAVYANNREVMPPTGELDNTNNIGEPANGVVADGGSRADGEPTHNDPTDQIPNHEPANQEPPTHEPANQEPPTHEPTNQERQANHDPANQERRDNSEPANQERQGNHEPANQEPTTHEPANQEAPSHEPTNQEPPSHEPANQERQVNHERANQERQANLEPTSQEPLNPEPANQRRSFDVRELSLLGELRWGREGGMAGIVAELVRMCNRPDPTEMDSLSTIRDRREINLRNLRRQEQADPLLINTT